MSSADWILLAGVLAPILSALGAFIAARAGAAAGVKAELAVLRRDVDDASDNAKAANWRLDRIGAEPAPLRTR